MKDIEVGDQITETYDRNARKIITVTKVVSRKGRVRRVLDASGNEHALRVADDGSVREHQSGTWSRNGYRRTEPGDEKFIADTALRNQLIAKIYGVKVNDWPIEDVQRVLDAWPKPIASPRTGD